jgi:hypothetical protein
MDGREGYGFALASPSLSGRSAWLEAELRGLTTFSGGGREMDQEARQAYIPVGRHLGTNMAFGYRKVDGGLDGNRRTGRYIAHFLIGRPQVLTLSRILRVHSECWHDNATLPLNASPNLVDTETTDLVGPPVLLSATTDEVERLADSIKVLAEEAQLEVSGWTHKRIRLLLACLPDWCDVASELIPKWTNHGGVTTLRLRELDFGEPTDRLTDWVEDAALVGIRERWSSARDPGQMRALGRQGSVKAAGVPQAASPLTTAKFAPNSTGLDTWLRKGSRSLLNSQRDALLADPVAVLGELVSQGRRLPDGDRVDDLAVMLIRRCPSMDPVALTRILPLDDYAVSALLSQAGTPALLKAALILNASSSRWVEIPSFAPDSDAISDVVGSAPSDETIKRGLARSLWLSVDGEGDFARSVLWAKGPDTDYLYRTLVPLAARGNPDAMLALVCINPERFFDWSGIDPQYRDALIEALRPDRGFDMFQRLFSRVSKWRRRKSAKWRA